jgi:hypothetical protein
MSIQPFRSDQMVVIERRFEDGTLDLRGEPQPPVEGMKFSKVYDMFFRETSNAPDRGTSASWDELRTWLEKKGWTVRAKTW